MCVYIVFVHMFICLCIDTDKERGSDWTGQWAPASDQGPWNTPHHRTSTTNYSTTNFKQSGRLRICAADCAYAPTEVASKN